MTELGIRCYANDIQLPSTVLHMCSPAGKPLEPTHLLILCNPPQRIPAALQSFESFPAGDKRNAKTAFQVDSNLLHGTACKDVLVCTLEQLLAVDHQKSNDLLVVLLVCQSECLRAKHILSKQKLVAHHSKAPAVQPVGSKMFLLPFSMPLMSLAFRASLRVVAYFENTSSNFWGT
jgi:hypothetical protein